MKTGIHQLPPTLPAYIPELDGLRAFAILGVMGFHAALPGFGRGGLGTSLFFVLSGFLVTGILIDAEKGHGYLKPFYIRRALRIFPIYYLTFVALLFIGIWRGWQSSDWPWFAAFLQNYLFVFEKSPKFAGCFGQTWFLAVEEQFYLVWPFLIYFLGKRQVFIAGMGCILFASAVRWVVIVEQYSNPWTFAILPWSMDALGAGSVLAIAMRTLNKRTLDIACWSMFYIGTALLFLTDLGLGYSGRLLGRWSGLLVNPSLALLFTGLVGGVVLSPETFVSKILRNGALRYIGKISYGLFLYHSPLYELVWYFFKNLMTRPNQSKGITLLFVLCKFAAAFAVAALSWHLLEKPINALKTRFPYVTPTTRFS